MIKSLCSIIFDNLTLFNGIIEASTRSLFIQFFNLATSILTCKLLIDNGFLSLFHFLNASNSVDALFFT